MGRDREYLAFARRVAAAQAGDAAVDESRVPIEQHRADLRRTMAGVPREPVGSTDDIDLAGGDGVARRARLYRPLRAADGLETCALVYVHGGGWKIGDVESWDPVVRTLTNACGVSVVSVETRQAPEHPYPAAVDDAVAAVREVRARASELGLDAEQVGVAGDSSGGNVVAGAALRLRDEGDPPLALQLLVYPVVDVADAPLDDVDPDGLVWHRPPADEVVAPYLAGADPTLPYLSPSRAPDLRGLPPTVLVTAEYDRLAAQARAYATRLREASVDVALVEGRGLDHGFVAWTPYAARPREVVADVGVAVRRLLIESRLSP